MDNGEHLQGFVREDELRLEEFFSGQSDEVKKMAGGFKAMRWGPEEITAFLNTAKLSGSSITRSGVNAGLMLELSEAKKIAGMDVDYTALKKSGTHVTTLGVELDSEQQQFMRDDLAGLTVLQFPPQGKGERVKHSVAHAMNIVMGVQLFRRVPKNAMILEVGASLRAAVRRGHFIGRYFASKPALDQKDLQRYHSELRSIRVALRKRGRGELKDQQVVMAESLLADPECVVIKKKVQEIDIGVEYILSMQSNWDIPVVQVPAIMYNCGAKAWYMVMNRISGLDFFSGKRSGREPGLNIVWEADADEDRIVFFFDGDSSLPYTHKLSVVRAYQTLVAREFVCKGRHYYMTETDMSTRSQLVLSCVDMGAREVAPMKGFDCSTTGMENMVQVTVPSLVSGVARFDRKRFEKVSFMVGAEAFSRVLQERMIAGFAGSVDSVIAFARSNRVSVVYNGVRVSVEHPVAVEHFRQFAVAVDALAVDMLRSADIDAKAMVASLAGGGVSFRTAAAMLGSATGLLDGASALFDAVVQRLRTLAEMSEDVASVTISAVSGVKKVPRSSRTRVVAAGERREPLARCYCAEKRELANIIAGDQGGLSEREYDALIHYRKVLASRVCISCESLEEMLCRQYKQDEEEREASEQFFDCDDTLAAKSDSGYSSSNGDKSSENGGSGASLARTEPVVLNGAEVEEVVEPVSTSEERRVLRLFEEVVGSTDASCLGSKTRMRRAAEEYVHVLDLQMRAVEDDMRQKRMIASMTGSDHQDTLDCVSDEHCWYSYVDVAGDGRIVRACRQGVQVDHFQRVYDYRRDVFCPVTRKKDGSCWTDVGVSSRVCTSGKMKMWNGPKLLDSSLRLMRSGGWIDGPEVIIDFVNGVFGCGKTRGIRKSYVEQVDKPGRRLIVTSTAKAAEQLREELFGSKDSPFARKFVRTYDSVLMHGVSQWFEEVAMDELAALTMGQAVLILAYLRPEKIRAYGDFYQMEPKPFCDWTFEYPSVEPLCRMEYMSMSHRVRLSVMASSLKLYPPEAGLSVCNCCEHVTETEEGGPEVFRISSVAQVPMESGVVYFTAGQGDARAVREQVRASGAVERGDADKLVCTYAESQGMTVKGDTICVRLETKTKPGSIHHEAKRINVGKSRSMAKVRYYTASDERDAMVLAAADARDESLRNIVRENSVKAWKKIQEMGSADAAVAHCFDMKKLEYRF